MRLKSYNSARKQSKRQRALTFPLVTFLLNSRPPCVFSRPLAVSKSKQGGKSIKRHSVTMDDDPNEPECANEKCAHIRDNLKYLVSTRERQQKELADYSKIKAEVEILRLKLVTVEEHAQKATQRSIEATNAKEMAEAEMKQMQSTAEYNRRKIIMLQEQADDAEQHKEQAISWRNKYDTICALAEKLENNNMDVKAKYEGAVKMLEVVGKKTLTLQDQTAALKTTSKEQSAKYKTLDKYLKSAIQVIDALSSGSNLSEQPKTIKDLVTVFRRDDVRLLFNAPQWKNSMISHAGTSSDAAEISDQELEPEPEDPSDPLFGGNTLSDDESEEDEDIKRLERDLTSSVIDASKNKKNEEIPRKQLSRRPDFGPKMKELHAMKNGPRVMPVRSVKNWPSGVRKSARESSTKNTAIGVVNSHATHSTNVPVYTYDAVNEATSTSRKAPPKASDAPAAAPSTSTASIHGRKVKTVREQQTEMMKGETVKEKVARMKAAAEEGNVKREVHAPSAKSAIGTYSGPELEEEPAKEPVKEPAKKQEEPKKKRLQSYNISEGSDSEDDSLLQKKTEQIKSAPRRSRSVSRSSESSRRSTRMPSKSVTPAPTPTKQLPARASRQMSRKSPTSSRSCSVSSTGETSRQQRARARSAMRGDDVDFEGKELPIKKNTPSKLASCVQVVKPPPKPVEHQEEEADIHLELPITKSVGDVLKSRLRAANSPFAMKRPAPQPIDAGPPMRVKKIMGMTAPKKKNSIRKEDPYASGPSPAPEAPEREAHEETYEIPPIPIEQNQLTEASTSSEAVPTVVQEPCPNSSAADEKDNDAIGDISSSTDESSDLTVQNTSQVAGGDSDVNEDHRNTSNSPLSQSLMIDEPVTAGSQESVKDEEDAHKEPMTPKSQVQEESAQNVPEAAPVEIIAPEAQLLEDPVTEVVQKESIAPESQAQKESAPEAAPVANDGEPEAPAPAEAEEPTPPAAPEELPPKITITDDLKVVVPVSPLTLAPKLDVVSTPKSPKQLMVSHFGLDISDSEEEEVEAVPAAPEATSSSASDVVKEDPIIAPVAPATTILVEKPVPVPPSAPVPAPSRLASSAHATAKPAAVKPAPIPTPSTSTAPPPLVIASSSSSSSQFDQDLAEDILFGAKMSKPPVKKPPVAKRPAAESTPGTAPKRAAPVKKTPAQLIGAPGLKRARSVTAPKAPPKKPKAPEHLTSSAEPSGAADESAEPAAAVPSTSDGKDGKKAILIEARRRGRPPKSAKADVKPIGTKEIGQKRGEKAVNLAKAYLRQALDLKVNVQELKRPMEEKGIVLGDSIPLSAADAAEIMMEFLRETSAGDMWAVMKKQRNEGNVQPLLNTEEQNFLQVSVSLIDEDQLLLELFIGRILSELAVRDTIDSKHIGRYTRLFCHAVRFVEKEDDQKVTWLRRFFFVLLHKHQHQLMRAVAYCFISDVSEHCRWLVEDIDESGGFSTVFRTYMHLDSEQAAVVNWLLNSKFQYAYISPPTTEQIRETLKEAHGQFLTAEDSEEMCEPLKTSIYMAKTGLPVCLDLAFQLLKQQMTRLDGQFIETHKRDMELKHKSVFSMPNMYTKMTVEEAKSLRKEFEWQKYVLMVMIDDQSTNNWKPIVNAMQKFSAQVVAVRDIIDSSSCDQLIEPSAVDALREGVDQLAQLISHFTNFPLKPSVLEEPAPSSTT
ncbi:unnamed protein product [Caenorhabditis sp. 36 PRJEB53466]|nr:unnamed protein product [Caenorhabditis sp. 36 PRJEB53466]